MSQREQTILRMLDMGFSGELSENDWRALGFRELDRVRDGFERLRARVDVARVVEVNFGEILRALANTCDPDQAFAGLERWLEAGGAGTDATGWSDEAFLGPLCILFAATPALAEHFIRFPNRTRPVLNEVIERKVKGREHWRKLVASQVSTSDSHQKQLSGLRRARTEAMLQIAALDLGGVFTLEHTVQALSDLADACIDAAIGVCVERLRPQYGAPPAPDGVENPGPESLPFVVLGLGKLGGRELNYSSDIDLIFAFEGTENDQTEGTVRPESYPEYFRRLGEALIEALDQVTEDGKCYRVDMRLRPYGAIGQLVMSVADTLSYLQSEGRTWERQAWLKARPVGGNQALGNALLDGAQTFIFRRFLSLDAIGDIKWLKRQMELQVERKGQSADEVKLGRGGIRDIEFTLQFLQLMHGGNNPALRGRSSIQALFHLDREGLLDSREHEQLEEAYVFLRTVEHRLQLHGNIQTHLLPSQPEARRRVAISMGFEDAAATDKQPAKTAGEAFDVVRERHVEAVRNIFNGHFATLFPETAAAEGALSDQLLAPDPDPAAIAEMLPHFGFEARTETAKELIKLRRERLVLANPSRTRKLFASVAPLLLKALAATGEPEGALNRFAGIAGSLGGHAVLYQSLHAHPWLLRMITELAAWSEYLTGILIANPGLFDELVDALRTERSKTLREMETELSRITTGGEVGATLRAYRSGELLRIGVRELMHSFSLRETMQELTDLAIALLRKQLDQTIKTYQEERGKVLNEAGKEVGFAILGVGKFGGREMNFGSDLDVLFFYGEEGSTEDGWPAGTYFAELSQALTRAMQERTALGRLYELDARLRPNGSKGPLASSLKAFEDYWKSGSMADWERLALTRARMVAGDPGVGERAEHLIRTAVYSPLQSSDLPSKVLDMRKRIEEHGDKDDLKTGRGGIVDIEFLVQYLQLVYGPAFPPLRQTNTRDSLERLVKHRKIAESDGDELLEAYRFFSRMSNRVRIVHGLSGNTMPSGEADIQKLALRAQYIDSPEKTAGEQLSEDYRRHTDRVREIFEKALSD